MDFDFETQKCPCSQYLCEIMKTKILMVIVKNSSI